VLKAESCPELVQNKKSWDLGYRKNSKKNGEREGEGEKEREEGERAHRRKSS
jgi:hypothetical protein